MNTGILVATQSGTVNLNIDQKTLDMCLRNVDNFGNTIIQNICNGQSVTVQWGSMGWFWFWFFIGAAVFLALMFLIGAFNDW
jgi:fructose-1,6-bisphosphatase